MQDQDKIIVLCAASNPNPNKENTVDNFNFTQIQIRKIKKANNKKSSRRKNPIIRKEPEDCRAQHSIILTKLDKELQPCLKDIQAKLSALELLHQSPKSKNTSKTCADEELNESPGSGIGGKVGKPHFVVQVGDVHNSYKTTKSSVVASPPCQGRIPTLDLNGCTRDEAINKLNESLKVWVGTAMKEYCPFVITVVIICGCRSQVVLETVQEWVKSTSQIRNAPNDRLV